jgi:hypothetical protein
MAHLCRTCREPHFAVHSGIAFPLPDALARMEPLLPDLLEAAREFDSFDLAATTAVEFVAWLAVDAHRANDPTIRRPPVKGAA